MASSVRTILSLFLFVAVAVQGFSPASNFKTVSPSKTSLQFGFLKELGLEKPSWLPDFGGSKKDEPVSDAEPTEDEGTDGEEATAEE